MTLVSGQSRRAALGEIGNKVINTRTNEQTGKSSQTIKDKLQLLKKPILPITTKQAQIKLNKVEKVVPKKEVIKPTVVNAKCETKPTNTQLEKVDLVNNKNNEAELKKDLDANAANKNKTDSFSSEQILIEDIDEEDKNNPILVSVYSNDIYTHLRNLEAQFPITKGYLQGQEVTPKMRCVLVDWLIEVHEQFHLMQETLYLTIAIIDRFLQVKNVIFNSNLN